MTNSTTATIELSHFSKKLFSVLCVNACFLLLCFFTFLSAITIALHWWSSFSSIDKTATLILALAGMVVLLNMASSFRGGWLLYKSLK